MAQSRVALVTGASSGIGAAVAQALAAAGYQVFGAARRLERMAYLQPGAALALDLTDEASIRRCADSVLGLAGRIDVLVNNAGYGSFGPVETVPLEEARRQFQVNLFGPARLIQLLVPHMREQGHGTIINVSSVAGRVHTPLGAWYTASKHALEGFSDALRLELEPFGIQVIVIQPGVTATEIDATASIGMVAAAERGPYEAFARGAKRLVDRNRRGASHPQAIADTVSEGPAGALAWHPLCRRLGRQAGSLEPGAAFRPGVRPVAALDDARVNPGQPRGDGPACLGSNQMMAPPGTWVGRIQAQPWRSSLFGLDWNPTPNLD
jgi:NAD(P)-dependent dehydrogenase (short-subunit alcohol dehydrogenase family)